MWKLWIYEGKFFSDSDLKLCWSCGGGAFAVWGHPNQLPRVALCIIVNLHKQQKWPNKTRKGNYVLHLLCMCISKLEQERKLYLFSFHIWFSHVCCFYELVLKKSTCLKSVAYFGFVCLVWYMVIHQNVCKLAVNCYLLWCESLTHGPLCWQNWQELRTSVDCRNAEVGFFCHGAKCWFTKMKLMKMKNVVYMFPAALLTGWLAPALSLKALVLCSQRGKEPKLTRY